MARIKRGVAAHQRHKKLLKLTKGHRGGRHKLYRQAKESLIHALQHSYNHRKERKGDMRRLWILRINAASRQNGLSYSQFVSGLKKASISVDRKILAELAVRDSEAFAKLAVFAKETIETAA